MLFRLRAKTIIILKVYDAEVSFFSTTRTETQIVHHVEEQRSANRGPQWDLENEVHIMCEQNLLRCV